jgi:hypothetical protein
MVAIPASAPKSAFCNTTAEMIASSNPETRMAGHEKLQPKTKPTSALPASRIRMVASAENIPTILQWPLGRATLIAIPHKCPKALAVP